ncbi:Hypothetical protein GLP15_3453 [Giardia lamblia P15]|uniref:Uncharacterized protein n=1 Tax=Giardia intestinalis (strain P15) TaxID=658858 RepID=E1F0C4_GIAIA|nr:Hypothetical protein GLP15_3453 [Giardia lamblia P15]
MLIELTSHDFADQAGQFDPLTQYIPVVYFRQSVYVDFVPPLLFQPETRGFVETTATFRPLCATHEEELSVAHNEFVYVIINAVQPPKKAKRPADDVSYPELSLIPCFAYAEIALRDIINPSNLVDNNTELPDYTYCVSTKVIPLIFTNTFSTGLTATLKVTIKISIPNPDYHDLHKIAPVLSGVEFIGNFSNLGKITQSTLPAFGWSLSLYLPGLHDTPLATVHNGYLDRVEKDIRQPTKIQTVEDVVCLSSSQKYQLVFPEFQLLFDQNSITSSMKVVSQLSGAGEKAGVKNTVDPQSVANTVLGLLTDCYHIGVPASSLIKRDNSSKKPIETGKQDTAQSATYGGVTFSDTYNALRELLQATYTNALLVHYDTVAKEVAALDESSAGVVSKGAGVKQQKTGHPSLEPKNQVKQVTIIVENAVEFLRFPLFYAKRYNTQQVFYLSGKALQHMRSAALSGSDSCCRLVLRLEALPDGALLNCLIDGNASGRVSIGGQPDSGLDISSEDLACETYIDLQAHLMDHVSPHFTQISEALDSDIDNVPLHKHQVIISFSAEPLIYTESTAALIAEQITSTRSQLEALPTGVISKTDLVGIQSKLNSNFGIIVHPIVTNVARPLGHMDIGSLPIILDHSTILSNLRTKVIPLSDLLIRLQNGHNSVDKYIITTSDFIKRLFIDSALPPAQDAELDDYPLICHFKECMRKVFMDKSTHGSSAEVINTCNQTLNVNSRSRSRSVEKSGVDRQKSFAAIDLLLTKHVREFKDSYMKKTGKAMPIAQLHHKLMCAAKEAYTEAKQKQRKPEELLEYGDALLYSKARHEAARAIELYSAALVRERQRRRRGEHTMLIERAVEGLLRAFIYTRNKTGVSRSLLRVFSIPLLHDAAGQTDTIMLSRLVLLTCHELISSGEDEYLALSLLYCANDLFNFDFRPATPNDRRQILERILLKVTCMDLFKVLNFSTEYNELKSLLIGTIRKVCLEAEDSTDNASFYTGVILLNLPLGAHDKYSRNYVPDDYIIVSLRLALAEYLLLEGSVPAAQKCLSQLDISTSLLPEQYSSTATKKVIISARCAILEGRLGDAKSLLLRDTLLVTKGSGDFNPCTLFQDLLGSADDIATSYLDLLDQSLDINAPGLLGNLALIGAFSHTVPAIFSIINRNLPRFAVAHAIQGDFNSVVPLPSWSTSITASTKSYSHSKTGNTNPQPTSNEAILSIIPESSMVSTILLNDIRGLTFTSIIFNSRVSLDMLLQAHAMYRFIEIPVMYYGGLLDCPVLTGFSFYDDTYMCRIILSLCARHIPVQDCIPFIVPFEKPSEDEFAVATKVFESIKQNLDEEDGDQYHNPLEFQTLKPVSPSSNSSNFAASISGSFTTDYLGIALPQTARGVSQLVETIGSRLISSSASTISANYFSSELLGTMGIIMLYAGKQDHLKALTRAVELDAFSFPSWCGLALSLSSMLASHVDGRVHKFSLEQIRDKIVECTGRMLDIAAAMNIVPFNYAFIAIAQSLLDTMAEDTTILSQTALKLLDKVRSDIPLIPFCVNTSKTFPTYFLAGASLHTSWFINRLKALAYVSCGTLVDVADAYLASLKGIGGVLPGRSIAEIAERVLLMAETSYSYEACNRIKDAEDVMNNGLTRLK